MKLYCSKQRESDSGYTRQKRRYVKNLDKNVIYKFDHYPNSDDDTFNENR